MIRRDTATTSTPLKHMRASGDEAPAVKAAVPCHPSSANDGDQKSIWNDCGILPIDNVQRHPHAKGKGDCEKKEMIYDQ